MWIGIALIVAGFGIIVAAARTRGTPRRRPPADHGRESLRGVTLVGHTVLQDPAERRAYDLLQSADLGQAHILAKVRLEDFIDVLAPDPGRLAAAAGSVQASCVDFLLVDSRFVPLLAVEVDAGPRVEEPAQIGAPTEALLEKADVPLLRLRGGMDWRAAIADISGDVGRRHAGAGV